METYLAQTFSWALFRALGTSLAPTGSFNTTVWPRWSLVCYARSCLLSTLIVTVTSEFPETRSHL